MSWRDSSFFMFGADVGASLIIFLDFLLRRHRPMDPMAKKRRWMLSIREGDEVCDCRYRHLKIISVREIRMPRLPRWFRMAMWTPVVVDQWVEWFCRRVGLMKVVDKDLLLEDGSRCSAMNCCDRVDHAFAHVHPTTTKREEPCASSPTTAKSSNGVHYI